MVKTRRKWLRSIDCVRIKDAIQKTEQQTSGEICVSISSLFWGNSQKAAEQAFIRLGMTHTQQRNGVLLFVVPARRKLIVLGDLGIHQKVGAEFWQRVVAVVTERFRAGDFTGGLLRGIEEVGKQLAVHFPCDATSNVNELPNEVDIDADREQVMEKRS